MNKLQAFVFGSLLNISNRLNIDVVNSNQYQEPNYEIALTLLSPYRDYNQVTLQHLQLKEYADMIAGFAFEHDTTEEDIKYLLETNESQYKPSRVESTGLDYTLSDLILEIHILKNRIRVSKKLLKVKLHQLQLLNQSQQHADQVFMESLANHTSKTYKTNAHNIADAHSIHIPYKDESLLINEDETEDLSLEEKIKSQVKHYIESDPAINLHDARKILSNIPGITIKFKNVQGDHGAVTRSNGTRIDTLDEGKYKNGMSLKYFIRRRTQVSKRVSLEVNERKQRLTESELYYGIAKYLNLI